MVGDILARWGEIDILVNNAGIWTYLEMGRMDEVGRPGNRWPSTLTAFFTATNAVRAPR